ncbi:GNAT family N-acetyltransferase [Streptomyces sp. CAU 1734]|uniref:GNAT family N-acetyltransferase n=1 Tax=Streptomyces sp. CAU 1734 TaxID=3140360 RepID=UPI00325FE273
MNDLVTARLILHPLTAAEARTLVAGGPVAAAHWAPGYPDAGDIRAARGLLMARAGGDACRHPGVYEIRRREDGLAIGGVGFHGPGEADGSVTVGYGLVPSARGHGYAAEALRALLASAREQGISRVKGDADHDNTASQRVMAAAGMRPAGRDERVVFYETDWEL